MLFLLFSPYFSLSVLLSFFSLFFFLSLPFPLFPLSLPFPLFPLSLPPPLVIEKTSLLDILRNILDSQELSDNVDVVLPQSDVIARCDSQRMRIVFLNLLLNSIDAVGKSGKIQIRFHDYKELVKVEFEDSGSVLEEKDIEHLFEPLFTTKQKGTGLGLSSVQNIIKEHGGTVSVTLHPTIFTIILPKTLD